MKQKRYGVTTKTLVAMLALVLLIGCGIGGTLAYLTSKTDEVVNTFTVGNINIDLWEHKYDPAKSELSNTEKVPTTDGVKGNTYKIVPGVDLPKDPTVEVVAGSEACWLFVKVTENNWPTDGNITYMVNDSNWTPLTIKNEDNADVPVNGVYYKQVDAASASAGAKYEVLKDNKITVKDALTKTEVEAIGDGFSLSFKAAAVQQEGLTVEEAYDQIANDLNN